MCDASVRNAARVAIDFRIPLHQLDDGHEPCVVDVPGLVTDDDVRAAGALHALRVPVGPSDFRGLAPSDKKQPGGSGLSERVGLGCEAVLRHRVGRGKLAPSPA